VPPGREENAMLLTKDPLVAAVSIGVEISAILADRLVQAIRSLSAEDQAKALERLRDILSELKEVLQ
jgi:hypothetical protein